MNDYIFDTMGWIKRYGVDNIKPDEIDKFINDLEIELSEWLDAIKMRTLICDTPEKLLQNKQKLESLENEKKDLIKTYSDMIKLLKTKI